MILNCSFCLQFNRRDFVSGLQEGGDGNMKDQIGRREQRGKSTFMKETTGKGRCISGSGKNLA